MLRSTTISCSLIGGAVAAETPTSASAPAAAGGQTAAFDANNCFVALKCIGFFPGEKRGVLKPLTLYAIRKDGQWVSGMANSNLNGGATYNQGLYPCDLSQLRMDAATMSGSFTVTIPPDPWIPADRKTRTGTVSVQLAIGPAKDPKTETASATGSFRSTWPGVPDDEMTKAGLIAAQGEASIGFGGFAVPSADNQSFSLIVPDLIPGSTPEELQRRRWISLGYADGKGTSTRFASVDIQNKVFGINDMYAVPSGTVTSFDMDLTTTVPLMTLDGDDATATIRFVGKRLNAWVAGSWTADFTINGVTSKRSGHFRGDAKPGAYRSAPRDERPWFVPVPDHKPVQAGEHPRLFFRAADVPELRRRAATPEGQRIVARLKVLLGGGEAMPTSLNPSKVAYQKNNTWKAVEGSFTISHAAGFGFLWQLTGDKKYADLAKQCLELGFKGQRDLDDRYAFVNPGGELRAGPSLGWSAVAYDLCYDAWDPAYRVEVAKRLATYQTKAVEDNDGEVKEDDGSGKVDLAKMIIQGRQGPASNHFGSVIGGCGLAVLALQGDPGTEGARLDRLEEILAKRIINQMENGFGDTGFFHEGQGPGGIASDTAFVPMLQAMRVAKGRDYANAPRRNVRWLALTRVLEVVGPRAWYPHRTLMGGSYGTEDYESTRAGLSRGGQYVQGFGIIPDAAKPALLWSYEHMVEADPAKRNYDTVSPYPHRAMLALINWPIGVAAKNPAGIVPLAVHDRHFDLVTTRNRWQDANDTLITAMLASSGNKPRDLIVRSQGKDFSWYSPPFNAGIQWIALGADGSAMLRSGGQALIIDYSKAGGCDAVVAIGRVKVDAKELTLKGGPAFAQTRIPGDAWTWDVLTIAPDGKHPTPTAQGKTLTIGKQSWTVSDTAIAAAVFTAQAP